MNYMENNLLISVIDNGIGFDMTKNSSDGIGLINMKRRGALINTEVAIESEENKGTQLKISHNF